MCVRALIRCGMFRPRGHLKAAAEADSFSTLAKSKSSGVAKAQTDEEGKGRGGVTLQKTRRLLWPGFMLAFFPFLFRCTMPGWQEMNRSQSWFA